MGQIDMAIDKNIYNNGIKGLLSYYEIDSLPRDYEVYKGMFREATETRTGIPFRKMPRLEEEKRITQVLSKASYGIHREKEFSKCDEYGKITKWQRFKMNVKFIFNIKKWWILFQLRRELKKKWKTEKDWS